MAAKLWRNPGASSWTRAASFTKKAGVWWMTRPRCLIRDAKSSEDKWMPAASLDLTTLPLFRNEPYADFSRTENRQAMESALAKVRAEFEKNYPLLIAGERVETGDTLRSLNPSRPSEVVGIHHKASADLATKA